MRVPFLLYAAALVLAATGTLFALDRIIKTGSRGGDADISQEGIFFTGLCLTLVFITLTIVAFTGAFVLLKWFLGGLGASFFVFYVWRSWGAAKDRKLMKEMLTEEERIVRETAGRDPSNTAAWQRLAEICAQQGDPVEALRCFRKVCGLEPTEANVRRMKDMKEAALSALRRDRTR